MYIEHTNENVLTVQGSTTKPDSFRSIIRFLKENEVQYYTYYTKEEKYFRIVICNLHPLILTTEIGIAIEEKRFLRTF